MSDISNFSRWKDWLLIGLVGLVFSLLGYIANDNRSRIITIEAEIAKGQEIRQNGFERLRALEATDNRENMRDIEARLQRQIDMLERQIEEVLRAHRNGSSSR